MEKRVPEKGKHPWRLCPVSRKNPAGITQLEGHCQSNPSGHELFTADELNEIVLRYFKDLKIRPSSRALGFSNGSKFDDSIEGWTQF